MNRFNASFRVPRSINGFQFLGREVANISGRRKKPAGRDHKRILKSETLQSAWIEDGGVEGGYQISL
jgi:hypothetical protein